MIVHWMHRGFFAGEFVATTDDRTFSLGDYLEVTHTAPAYVAKTVGDKDVIAFPIQIDFSASGEVFPAELRTVGIAARHYMRCLRVGCTHTLTIHERVVAPPRGQKPAIRCYAPRIDGYIPGLLGLQKVL